MTLPPAYIKDLLVKTGADFVLLDPYTVHKALLVSYSIIRLSWSCVS
jgi:hypothetical protein